MNTVKKGRKTVSYGLAARISLGYALIASLWIYASDIMVAEMSIVFGGSGRLQMYKGWLFVAVTALLLYGLVLVVVRRAKAESPTATEGLFPLRRRVAPPVDPTDDRPVAHLRGARHRHRSGRMVYLRARTRITAPRQERRNQRRR